MATPMTVGQMLDALTDEGCNFQEYRAWRTHGRSHLPWGGVNGIVIHHTAGSDSLNFVYNGYRELPGPLAHAHLSKAGLISLTGHGRANHAGTFARNAHNAVVAESSTHPRPDASEPIDGNRHYYGIEIENLGNGGDPYPAVQYDQAVRWAAAICRFHGWSEHSVIGHKEGTRRKIDPSFDMDKFRRDVGARLRGATEGDDDMPGYVSLGMTKPFSLEPGKWVAVSWDTEWADHFDQHGDGWAGFMTDVYYNGAVHVRLGGLTPGKECQIRVSENDIGGGHARHLPIKEVIGTAGDTFGAVPIVGTVPEGRRGHIRICHFGDEPVTVKRVEVQANLWRR